MRDIWIDRLRASFDLIDKLARQLLVLRSVHCRLILKKLERHRHQLVARPKCPPLYNFLPAFRRMFSRIGHRTASRYVENVFWCFFSCHCDAHLIIRSELIE